MQTTYFSNLQIEWQPLLSALGVKPRPSRDGTVAAQYCPLHPVGHCSLQIKQHPVTGTPHFYCDEPTCMFSGDAVALVAAVRKIPIEQAVLLFRTDAGLMATLQQPLTDGQVADYGGGGKTNMAALQAYMAACRQEFLTTSNGHYVRSLLSTVGILGDSVHTLPPSIGVIRKHDIPYSLKALDQTQYEKHPYLLCPYTYDGNVLNVSLLRADTLESPVTILPCTNTTQGIFLEPALHTDKRSVYICKDELTALQCSTLQACMTTDGPPFICARSLPLPAYCKTVEHIYLLSFARNPFTLSEVLTYLQAEDRIEGGRNHPELHVVPIRHDAPTLGIVQGCRRNAAYANTPRPNAYGWVAQQMLALQASQQAHEITRCCAVMQLPDRVIKGIIDALRAHPTLNTEATIQVLQDLRDTANPDVTLANGNYLEIQPTALVAARDTGHRVLANCGIYVRRRIVTRTRKMYYDCVLQPDEVGAQPFELKIPHDICCRSQLLQAYCTEQLAQAGRSDYLAFYTVAGYSWLDILARLGTARPIAHELVRFGLDDRGCIQYPHVCLDTVKRQLLPQHNLYTHPRLIVDQFEQVRHVPDADLMAAMKPLLEAVDTSKTAHCLVAVLCCYLADQHQHAVATAKGHQTAVRHQLLVSNDGQEGIATLNCLSQLLSGRPKAQYCSASEIPGWLSSIKDLGSLAAVVNLGSLTASRLRDVVESSTTSLITCVAGTAAVMLPDTQAITYITPPSSLAEQDTGVDIPALRNVMAKLLLFPFMMEDSEFHAKHPRWLSIYAALCYRAGVQISARLRCTIASRYLPCTGAELPAFYYYVNQLLYEESPLKRGLTIEHEMAPDSEAPWGATVYLGNRCTWLSKSITKMVRHEAGNTVMMTPETIDAELKTKGHLVPELINHPMSSQYWPIRLSVWLENAVREPIVLPPVQLGNVIQLRRVAN